MKGGEDHEEPEAIFERINRRRAARRATAHSAAGPSDAACPSGPSVVSGAPGASAPAPARAAPPAPTAPAALPVAELVDDERRAGGAYAVAQDALPDTFPRSTTVRTLLRHPAIAVGIGVPATVVLLRSRAARRLLQAGLVLGARPEVKAVVGAALAAAGDAMEARRRRARGAVDAAGGAAQPPAPEEPKAP